jgi:hypothetical protein
VSTFTSSLCLSNTDSYFTASLFIRDPVSEFTAHIDAPVEEVVLEKQARIEGRESYITPEKGITHTEEAV